MDEQYGERVDRFFKKQKAVSVAQMEQKLTTSEGESKDWRPETDMENAKEIADNLAFVKLALHWYYGVAKAAIRKYDKST